MKPPAIFVAIGLVAVGVTLVALRRQHIRAEYSVSWIVVGVILTALTFFPASLNAIARTCGLDLETCFLTICGVLVAGVVFEISHVVSRLRDENVMLAQQL